MDLATRLEHFVDTRSVRFGVWLTRLTKGQASLEDPRRAGRPIPLIRLRIRTGDRMESIDTDTGG